MYLIKCNGRVNEGTIEGLWYHDVVQSALTWNDPHDMEEFQALLDAGQTLKLGGGSVKVWRYDREDAGRK